MAIRVEATELIYNKTGFCSHPGTKLGTPPEGALKIPFSDAVVTNENGEESLQAAYACGLTKTFLTSAQKEQVKDGCDGCPKLPNQG